MIQQLLHLSKTLGTALAETHNTIAVKKNELYEGEPAGDDGMDLRISHAYMKQTTVSRLQLLVRMSRQDCDDTLHEPFARMFDKYSNPLPNVLVDRHWLFIGEGFNKKLLMALMLTPTLVNLKSAYDERATSFALISAGWLGLDDPAIGRAFTLSQLGQRYVDLFSQISPVVKTIFEIAREPYDSNVNVRQVVNLLTRLLSDDIETPYAAHQLVWELYRAMPNQKTAALRDLCRDELLELASFKSLAYVVNNPLLLPTRTQEDLDVFMDSLKLSYDAFFNENYPRKDNPLYQHFLNLKEGNLWHRINRQCVKVGLSRLPIFSFTNDTELSFLLADRLTEDVKLDWPTLSGECVPETDPTLPNFNVKLPSLGIDLPETEEAIFLRRWTTTQ